MIRPTLLLCLWLAACTDSNSPAEFLADRPKLRIRKGTFVQSELMTGYLKSPGALKMGVPSHSWNYTIRWLIPDGSTVQKGGILAKLDKTALQSQIKGLEETLLSAKNRLQEQRVNAQSSLAEKQHLVHLAEIALSKAKLSADVPKETYPRLVYEDMQQALRRTKSALQAAQEAVLGEKKLGNISVSRSRISLQTPQRELTFVQSQMESYTLLAPKDGLVAMEQPWREKRPFQVGDKIFSGQSLLSFPDLHQMGVVTELADIDDGRIHLGMKVRITLDSYPDRQFQGIIKNISPVASAPDENSVRRRFEVSIELAETDPEIMRPGMAVRVETIGQTHGEALLVPRAALFYAKDGTTSVRTESGLEQKLKLGACNHQQCIVLSGIELHTSIQHRKALQ